MRSALCAQGQAPCICIGLVPVPLGALRPLPSCLELEPVAIADAIEAIPADAWDEATLTALRGAALDIGRLLRAIAAVAEGHRD